MNEEKKKQVDNIKKKFYFPRRYVLCILTFCAFCTMNCQRSCLSVAIVAMSSRTKHWESGKWTSKPAEFDWDSERKGVLLGAFFYGYLWLQIPGGWLCLKFGGKRVLGLAVFTASLICTMLPILVRINENLFFAGRICQGLFLGCCLPTNHFMWGKWAPTNEKSTLVSFSIAGLSAGMLCSYPISGVLCQYGFAGGWPSVFYVFGALGMLWSVAWYVLISNTPLDHPSISKEELAIMDQIDYEAIKNNREETVPWCRIIRSVPVWAVIFANFAFDCSYYTLLITMPLFLRDIHKFNVATTGVVSAFPWFFMAVSTPLAGLLADRFRKNFSVTTTRKVFFFAGVFFSGLFLIISGYLKSAKASIGMQCVSVFFFGFAFSAVMVNALDIGQQHGGIIIGLSNSIATTPGFIGPAIVGMITKDGTAAEWLKVFYGLAASGIIGGFLFMMFGSGKPCDWTEYRPVSQIIEEGEDTVKKKVEENRDDDKIERELKPLQRCSSSFNTEKMRDTG